MRTVIIVLGLLSALLVGCAAEDVGTLVLQITDQPSELNIEQAVVTLSQIEVHTSADNETESGWATVVQGPVQYDLIAIKDIKELLGSTNLTAGRYTQMRLHVDEATGIIDGEEVALEIPSGVVRLVQPFDIVAGQETVLTLDFDAQESITRAGSRYILRPTIRVVQE